MTATVWTKNGKYRRIVEICGRDVTWCDPSARDKLHRTCSFSTWTRWVRSGAVAVDTDRLRIVGEVEARIVIDAMGTDTSAEGDAAWRALFEEAVLAREALWQTLVRRGRFWLSSETDG